ncbi:MAG: flippase [Ignavibacteriaceae bacterium]|nr:flippase [Ignavibacteriaceae bacterium]
MIKRVRALLKQKDKNKLIENIFSLSVLHAANYILPLITLPYLVRVLGPEKFGLIAFAQAFIQYFMMLTDFGFNLSATREISINRNNKEKVVNIFFSVFAIKIVLLLLSFLILLLTVTFFLKFNAERTLYFYTFLSVVGWVMFPQWFYQGIENMKFITFFNLGAKLFFTICIFIFIKTREDYLLLSLLNSFGYILSGMLSLVLSFKYFKIHFCIPSFSDIRHQFYEGWHVFLSNLAINMYTTSNSVILGILTNNVLVGYYSAAEKVFKAFQYMGIPIYQALFPHFSKLIVENRTKAIHLFNKLFKMTMIISFTLSLILTFLSPIVVHILLGVNYNPSIAIFSILAWVILASLTNYTLGIQGLVNFGYQKIFSKIVLIFSFIHIILIIISIKIFGYLAVPVVWFLTESAISLVEYRYLKKINIII